MPVITISRQPGCFGSRIAATVAERLHLRLVDHDIMDEVARRLGVTVNAVQALDEREGTIVSDLVSTMRRLYPATIGPQAGAADIDHDSYLRVVRQVIEEVARTGDAVIIGRGGNFIVGEDAGILNVLLIAPFETRVERIMADTRLTRAQASQRVRAMDAERSRYIRHCYGGEWLQPLNYDLVINTAHFDVAAASALITVAALPP